MGNHGVNVSCSICSKEVGNLEVHMRVHTGEKPYPCDLCEKRFNQNSNLNTHIYLMHGDPEVRPFECTICEMSFKLKAGVYIMVFLIL